MRVEPAPPILVYAHGGVLFASIAAVAPHRANEIVVSVEYRLAPEPPFPGMSLDEPRSDEMEPMRAASLAGMPPTILQLTADVDDADDAVPRAARRLGELLRGLPR